jgi:hypothetical protein
MKCGMLLAAVLLIGGCSQSTSPVTKPTLITPLTYAALSGIREGWMQIGYARRTSHDSLIIDFTNPDIITAWVGNRPYRAWTDSLHRRRALLCFAIPSIDESGHAFDADTFRLHGQLSATGDTMSGWMADREGSGIFLVRRVGPEPNARPSSRKLHPR